MQAARRPARHTTQAAASFAVLRRLAAWCLAGVVALALHADGPTVSGDGQRWRDPDVVADQPGGTAARLFDADGIAIPGHVFLLIGPTHATEPARLFDATPYVHDGQPHPDTVASNLVANSVAQAVTGSTIDFIAMTSARGGGPSGGLTRAIAYLNVVSDGAFTGDLRVAATGTLNLDGHVGSIDHIDSKFVAARLADVDVLFTPTVPSSGIAAASGASVVGELARDQGAGGSLHDPQRLDRFRSWGEDRSGGIEIVDSRHLIDVSSYLCGAGSDFACQVTETLDRRARHRHDELTRGARSENARLLSRND